MPHAPKDWESINPTHRWRYALGYLLVLLVAVLAPAIFAMTA